MLTEVPRPQELSVYAITATCSVMAYIWLLVILLVISPDVVDIWEGLLTLMFFPLLVLLAWLADKGYFSTGGDSEDDIHPGASSRLLSS